jgi:hypothetical protein
MLVIRPGEDAGMPPVTVLFVQWDRNVTYATKRASRSEIEEVFGNRPAIRTNLRGRVATHVAVGLTDAGRPLTVAFIYYADTSTAYPITSWERS